LHFGVNSDTFDDTFDKEELEKGLEFEGDWCGNQGMQIILY